MLNTSSVAHSILAEEVDNCNSNNNNNNSLLLNDLSFHNDEIITNGSLNYAVYDTAVFDVLKVDPEDFAVCIYLSVYPIDSVFFCSYVIEISQQRESFVLLTNDWLSKL